MRTILCKIEVHERLLSSMTRLTHRLNRKFVWTDDTTQDSEETATAFTVSKVAITREQSFSLQIHESKFKENVARSL